MKKVDFRVGDWVVVMDYDLVPVNYDASTWDSLPCIVIGIENDRIKLESPLKICHGRPPLDSAPACQLIKITEEDGRSYCNMIFEMRKREGDKMSKEVNTRCETCGDIKQDSNGFATVNVFKDGKLLTNQNDPSDVIDYLINFEKLPKELFLIKQPDKGFGWDYLPIRFVWNERLYDIDRNINSTNKEK